MRPDVRLLVDGQRYGGWKTIAIERGIEATCNSFDLTVTERWAGQDVARPIRPAATAELTIDGVRLINGYVDEVELQHSDRDHTVSVRGRDKTGDLVDCAAVHKSGEWTNVTLTQLAQDLARPFGIDVVTETDVAPAFAQWQIQEGETAWECIERAARMRGVLLTTNRAGQLVLGRAGAARAGAKLELGANLLRATGSFSMRDRFSVYTAKGAMPGTDFSTPEQNAAPFATVEDDGVPRYRPLIVIAEDNGDNAVLTRRATWERNVRYGRAARIEAVVQGWHAGPELWSPNFMVRYTDAFMGIDEDLLIASVRLTLDEGGFLSQLSLTRREAFDVEPLPLKKARKGVVTGLFDS